MEHFRLYWLYILDLKNLLIEKKLHVVKVYFTQHSALLSCFFKVANPMCPRRQELILESLTAGQIPARGAEQDIESVITELEKAKLSDCDPEPAVFCSCTRKCKTNSCLCRKSGRLCAPKCHVNNIKCQNR